MVEKKVIKKDTATISYIFGIISIVMAIISPLAGIIFGTIGMIQNKNQKDELSKKARIYNIIGIILGSIFLILLIIMNFYFLNQSANLFSGLYQ
jgi:fumarate reductase subunit D